jgi:NTE family protein
MKKNVTLVLSGGGARGFAHIGAIEEIEKRGYSINSVAGTSIGALIGGVFATGKINEFKEWIYALDKQKILRLVDLTLSNHGFVKGDKVLQAMRTFIPDANIEDLKIKFSATAYDLAHNREVVFKEGSLFKSIRASISIPTVFTPVITGNSVLVDGGVCNNIPVNNAYRMKNDILIAVNVNANIQVIQPFLPETEKERKHRMYVKKIAEIKESFFKTNSREQRINFNYFKLIDSTISSLTNNLAAALINGHPPDILIEVSRKSCGTFDFYKAEELVEMGRFAAQKKLDLLKD